MIDFTRTIAEKAEEAILAIQEIESLASDAESEGQVLEGIQAADAAKKAVAKAASNFWKTWSLRAQGRVDRSRKERQASSQKELFAQITMLLSDEE